MTEAPLADAHGLPRGDRFRRQPQGDVASLDQCSVVRRPVSDAVFRFVPGMHSRLHVEIMPLRPSRWPGPRRTLVSAHQRPDALQRPTLYDSGRPRAVIRLRTLHARRTSTACPPGLRARRRAPMIDLYLEEIPTDADRLTTFGTFALIEEAVQGHGEEPGPRVSPGGEQVAPKLRVGRQAGYEPGRES